MRIAYLQHVPFEGPEHIATWARARGHSFGGCRLHAGDPLPRIEDIDWLVIMGGPMSVHDDSELDWLKPEKRLVEQAIAQGKTVLGICLGAQLIADTLGSRVYRNAHKEIGWFPVRQTPSAREWRGAAALPETFTAFHWHGETFDIPAGATHWLSSAGCANQAFAYQDRVIGIQCHLEMTPAGAKRLIDNCGGDLGAGQFVQAPAALLSDERTFDSANIAMRSLLDRLESLGIDAKRKRP